MAALVSYVMANDIDEAVEALESVDGITAKETLASEYQMFVGVSDEDAIGMLYKVAREEGLNLTNATRSANDYVLDSWADLK